MHPFFTPSPQADGPDAQTRLHAWLALMELAMDEAGFSDAKRGELKSALFSFLVEFRNPGRLLRWEIRNYLYQKTELGAGAAPARSLPVAQAALAFFYEQVLPRPGLAEIARDPFLPVFEEPAPDFIPARSRKAEWQCRRSRKASTVFPLRNAFEADWSPRS